MSGVKRASAKNVEMPEFITIVTRHQPTMPKEIRE
jgi:hypothetical protein